MRAPPMPGGEVGLTRVGELRSPPCRPGGRRSRAHGLVGAADEAEVEVCGSVIWAVVAGLEADEDCLMDIGPGGGGGPVGAASGIGEYALVDGGFVAAVNPLASLPAGKPAHQECRPGGRRSQGRSQVS